MPSKIGVIGVGTLGSELASRLHERYSVLVYDIDQQRVDSLSARGLEAGASAREVARAADVVVLSLPTDATIRSVTLGEDGVVDALEPSNVLVETSTLSPELSREVAERCSQDDIGYLDAPVSWNPQSETLTVMVGGASKTFEKVSDVLDTFGGKVFHVGERGAGIAMKLANNYMYAINLAGLCEGLSMARKAGIDDETFTEVAKNASGRSNAVIRNMEGFIIPDDYEAEAAIRILAKDVHHAEAHAERLAVPLIVGGGIGNIYEYAEQLGLGEQDVASLIKLYETENIEISQ